MTTSIRPTVQRRRLRTELRRLREEMDQTREQVASAMDWSLSKLIRIEAGTVSMSTTDLKALLDHYRVTPGDKRDELVKLAQLSKKRMWWSELKDRVPPQLLTYVGFEAEANRIRYYSTVFIPGMFQTEEYARAIFSASSLDARPDEAVDAWVRLRLERQRRLSEGSDPPKIHAVIDEAALHRAVGGPKAMAAQLHHLAELATNPDITIEVLPFAAGENPGMARTFMIFEFGTPADDVVYVDGGVEDVSIQDAPDKVSECKRILDRLSELSLDEVRSLELIREVAASME